MAQRLRVERGLIIECRRLSSLPATSWIVFIKKRITVVCLELKAEQITRNEESQEGGQRATEKSTSKLELTGLSLLFACGLGTGSLAAQASSPSTFAGSLHAPRRKSRNLN